MMQVAGSMIAAAVDRRHAERELKRSMGFEHLITSLVSEFMNLPVGELDDGIVRALETIARFVGCDRSAIYMLDEDRDTASVSVAVGGPPGADRSSAITNGSGPPTSGLFTAPGCAPVLPTCC